MSHYPSLDYFLEIVKWKSISRAAKELHITQQSMSIYLKRLEQFYGVSLFERHPALHLTPEGQTLLDTALKISEAYHYLDEVFGRQPKGAHIRLGCVRIHSLELMNYLPLTEYRLRYPNVKVEIIEEPAPVLYQMLLNGELDFYLGNLYGSETAVEKFFFCEFPLFVLITRPLIMEYFPKDAPLRIERWKQGIRLEDLRSLPFITSPPYSRIRQLINTYAQEKEIAFSIVCESFNLELNRKMCLQHTGFTISATCRDLPEDAFLFPLLEPKLGQPVYCVWRKQRQLAQFQADFLEVIRKQSRGERDPDN